MLKINNKEKENKMESKIILNEYIKADIVADILSQSISAARKRVSEDNSKEAKDLLEKLLKYDKEVKNGNKEIMENILKGEI